MQILKTISNLYSNRPIFYILSIFMCFVWVKSFLFLLLQLERLKDCENLLLLANYIIIPFFYLLLFYALEINNKILKIIFWILFIAYLCYFLFFNIAVIWLGGLQISSLKNHFLNLFIIENLLFIISVFCLCFNKNSKFLLNLIIFTPIIYVLIHKFMLFIYGNLSNDIIIVSLILSITIYAILCMIFKILIKDKK